MSTKRLTDEQREEIRRVFVETGNQDETARRCGRSTSTVRNVIMPGGHERANAAARKSYHKRYKEDPEAFEAYNAARRERRTEDPAARKKSSAIRKAYSKNNPEKIATLNANRRARKADAQIHKVGTPERDRHVWIEVALRQAATALGDFLCIQLDVDHITPLEGSRVGRSGLHCVSNFQLLEKSANSSKGNRRIAVCPVGKKIVDYFVDIYDTAKRDITVPPVFQATEIGPLLDYLGDHTIGQLITELSTLKEFAQSPDTSSGSVVECSVSIPKYER
jgi:5-methylcytosine-specific restriction endonuclease McrA